ncbi:bifunctional diguanylate cyclase/phosphodiesterase [Novosphingobium capsulatum]|uniref:bifunctional diguanylate cyclase/phosphodiesterase n=1 Tax=Novosphingobium capsulatum TaxID=13688 RepID=UPI0009FF3F85|nr:bifunctional diguanylate cyclase/phosphodiesterase [Novosphingobium capsulatum]WQD94562.1 bifunctional diguanylate cyclase/phosphodiesterase [Novosphingobium capsulatum]
MTMPASPDLPPVLPAIAPGQEGLTQDGLTGLATAAQARDWLDWAGAQGTVQAMLIGLNRFQAVNLAFGHGGGDRVLAEVARRIAHFAAEELAPGEGGDGPPLVARVSGGEFLVASASRLSRERWQVLAQGLGRSIARPLALGGDAVRLLPRIALLRGQALEGGSALLDRLDQALAQLMVGGARRLAWADGRHRARGRSVARLEADLIGALHRQEIAVLYQPQFRVGDGMLAGAEALARWEHPGLGRIGAETLFAVAERADQMAPLSHAIAGAALAGAHDWPAPLRLSLNVTAEDFALPDFAPALLARADDAGFAPERLTIEITEQTLIADFDACAAALRTLAARGVAVALDDFGTGFSNFRTLKALPLDTLKLDRSLVRDVAHDGRDRAILAAMVAMARALSLSVVAEGVENDAQLAVLAQEGVDLFQGFLRAGPLDGAAMARLASGAP